MDQQYRFELEKAVRSIERNFECAGPARAKAKQIATASAPAVLTETAGGLVLRPEPFGGWLIAQRDRGDWIDDLAAAARADRAFPKTGNPDQVRAHLLKLGADGDAFEQVDDAERCWLSL